MLDSWFVLLMDHLPEGGEKNSTTQQGRAGRRQCLRLNYNEAKQSKVEERSLPTLLLGGDASYSHAS